MIRHFYVDSINESEIVTFIHLHKLKLIGIKHPFQALYFV